MQSAQSCYGLNWHSISGDKSKDYSPEVTETFFLYGVVYGLDKPELSNLYIWMNWNLIYVEYIRICLFYFRRNFRSVASRI